MSSDIERIVTKLMETEVWSEFLRLMFDEDSMRILITLYSVAKPLNDLQLSELAGVSQSALYRGLESLKKLGFAYEVFTLPPSYNLSENGKILAEKLPKLLDDAIKGIEECYTPKNETKPYFPTKSLEAIYEWYKTLQSRLREFKDNLNKKLKEKGL